MITAIATGGLPLEQRLLAKRMRNQLANQQTNTLEPTTPVGCLPLSFPSIIILPGADTRRKFQAIPEESTNIMAAAVPLEEVDSNVAGERSFFRSAPMSLIQLYIPTEAVQTVAAELGELGAIQFRDLNVDITAFQRTFTNDIRKLDALERKIRILLEQATREDVEVRSWITIGPVGVGGSSQVPLRGRALQELEELEPELAETESRVLQLDDNQREISSRYMQMLEWHSVLVALSPHLSASHEVPPKIDYINAAGVESSSETDASEAAHLDDKDAHSMELGGAEAAQASAEASFVAGAIAKKKLPAFERVLWRALRGNVYVRSADCVFDEHGLLPGGGADVEPKSAFVAYVHGRETLGRLRKICEALGCTLHDVDPSAERRHETIMELNAKLDDMYAVLFNTRQAKKAALGRVSESLERWLLLVRKKKALFDTMNKFSCDSDAATRKYFVAEGWCPTSKLPAVDAAIRFSSERAGLNVAPVLTTLDASGRMPPTYFPTNKFTQSFQAMTDSYGIGSYREANPSLFMIISFPFLFAVMFGDIGHGLIMALFAAWMVLDERRLLGSRLGEIFELIFEGRYIILPMGMFSVFTGALYNDLFSRCLSIFPSAWTFVDGVGSRTNPSYTYPFGIDPSWYISGNSMLFLNSYKMKLAVLLGICQMLFGLALAGTNFVAFDKWVDIWCMLLPQVLFMLSILGYLAFLILYKWAAGWDVSILNSLIAMIMKFGAVEGTPIFPGQALVQTALMFIAVICIPWMFAAKPIYLILQRRRRQGPSNVQDVAYQQPNGLENSDSNGTESISSTTRKVAAEDEENDMSELWVHQVIHTIEFVLGSISNTASYLRLWALSLAHAQLSDVLWQMTIEGSVTKPYFLFPIFIVWFAFTVTILVAMEGMSAFLHSLRLHWVEFNNKFYEGNGVKFEPFALTDDRLFLKATVE